MRYLVWALRLLVFLAVLLFALRNTELVTVHFWADNAGIQVRLIVVMLIAFGVGTLFGLLLTIPAALRRRREVVQLRRELDIERSRHAPAPSPDEVAPLAPL